MKYFNFSDYFIILWSKHVQRILASHKGIFFDEFSEYITKGDTIKVMKVPVICYFS